MPEFAWVLVTEAVWVWVAEVEGVRTGLEVPVGDAVCVSEAERDCERVPELLEEPVELAVLEDVTLRV